MMGGVGGGGWRVVAGVVLQARSGAWAGVCGFGLSVCGSPGWRLVGLQHADLWGTNRGARSPPQPRLDRAPAHSPTSRVTLRRASDAAGVFHPSGSEVRVDHWPELLGRWHHLIQCRT